MKKEYTIPAIEEQEIELENIIALSDGQNIEIGDDDTDEEVDQMSKDREGFGLW